ncbi:unnamed protein product, partial [Pleuronectes platessa]
NGFPLSHRINTSPPCDRRPFLTAASALCRVTRFGLRDKGTITSHTTHREHDNTARRHTSHYVPCMGDHTGFEREPLFSAGKTYRGTALNRSVAKGGSEAQREKQPETDVNSQRKFGIRISLETTSKSAADGKEMEIIEKETHTGKVKRNCGNFD